MTGPFIRLGGEKRVGIIIFRVSFGYLTSILRVSFEYFFRLSFGYLSVIFRVSFGYLSVIFRVSFEYLSSIFRVSFEYLSSIFRISFDYLLSIFRVSFEYLPFEYPVKKKKQNPMKENLAEKEKKRIFDQKLHCGKKQTNENRTVRRKPNSNSGETSNWINS